MQRVRQAAEINKLSAMPSVALLHRYLHITSEAPEGHKQVGQLWACVGRAQVVYSVQWPPQLVLGSTLFWACMAALAVVTERPALFMHN